MRRVVLSAWLVLTTGIAFAADLTLVKYDPQSKSLTVTDGKSEKAYRLTDKTKVLFQDRDGHDREGTVQAAIKALSLPKAPGRLKLDLTADRDVVEILKLKMTLKKKET